MCCLGSPVKGAGQGPGSSDSCSGCLPPLCTATHFVGTLQRRQDVHREQPHICTCRPFCMTAASLLFTFCPYSTCLGHWTTSQRTLNMFWARKLGSLLYPGSKPCQRTLLWEPLLLSEPLTAPSFKCPVPSSTGGRQPALLNSGWGWGASVRRILTEPGARGE